MSGPARAGLFVYAKDLERLAHFYESILGMARVHQSNDLVVLQSPDIQLLVHAIPPHIAATIVITSPPQRRENTALKFFFTVPSLQAARAAASALGGEVYTEQWEGPGFIVCNACDPEGNVFQVREPWRPQLSFKVPDGIGCITEKVWEDGPTKVADRRCQESCSSFW